ncbi:MAG: endonuclease/exonuclease/phosphatase family protein [Cyclobacteriaceae bacterium]
MRPIPNFANPAPAAAMHDFETMIHDLNLKIPRKTFNNLLIATWNIKNFSAITKKWVAEPGGSESPKRDYFAAQIIVEIISRYDVVAIQEIQGNIGALRKVINILGEHWSFLMTDVTLGSRGNSERLGYIFDKTRVKLSGLACELVIPPEWQGSISESTYDNQFSRTPYAVSFSREHTTFILTTLHINYSGGPAVRKVELEAIAKWMYDWASRSNKWHHNLLVLGDFNIDRRYDDLWQAFTARGLVVPDILMNAPRSIFAKDALSFEKYYDQIAWFTNGRNALKDLTLNSGGFYDFVPFSYSWLNMTRASIQHRISDHYPLWVEFRL